MKRTSSSRIRTAHSLPQGGSLSGGFLSGDLCPVGGLFQGDPLPTVDRQTPVKIDLLPWRPKLRLRAVKLKNT